MLTLTTPALLFSAISLLLLAYTNRFLALAALVRKLYDDYKTKPSEILFGQIKNLKTRISLIKNMQIQGITSLLLCVLSMFLIYIDKIKVAEFVFGVALVLLITSLALSVWEIQISSKALNLRLHDLDSKK